MPMKPSLRPKPADALVVLLVPLLAAGLFFLMRQQTPPGGVLAEVSSDGHVVYTENLGLLTQARELTLKARGYTLRLSFFPDGVEVAASDCPTQDCVHTGRITRAGQSIVCLPARVSVVLQGAGTRGVDAVVG